MWEVIPFLVKSFSIIRSIMNSEIWEPWHGKRIHKSVLCTFWSSQKGGGRTEWVKRVTSPPAGQWESDFLAGLEHRQVWAVSAQRVAPLPWRPRPACCCILGMRGRHFRSVTLLFPLQRAGAECSPLPLTLGAAVPHVMTSFRQMPPQSRKVGPWLVVRRASRSRRMSHVS